jgi:hypothetical protein
MATAPHCVFQRSVPAFDPKGEWATRTCVRDRGRIRSENCDVILRAPYTRWSPQGTCVTTRAEQETIFRYAADEDVVSVFTAHPPTARKLERSGYQAHKVSRRGGQPVGWFYNVPRSEFRWRVGTRKKRVMSEARRLALAETLRKARQPVA